MHSVNCERILVKICIRLSLLLFQRLFFKRRSDKTQRTLYILVVIKLLHSTVDNRKFLEKQTAIYLKRAVEQSTGDLKNATFCGSTGRLFNALT